MRRSLVVLALAALSSACGDNPPDPYVKSFDTGEFVVQPGESFECFYTSTFSDSVWEVGGSSGQQGPGGHHITVYYTTNPQPVGHHPCKDSEMLTWRLVAGSGGKDTTGAEGIVSLPTGLAIKIPPGMQIVTQSHYINLTDKAETVNDHVDLKLVDPASLKANANYMVANDDTFVIPPNQNYHSEVTCAVPQDLQVVLLLGHMHEKGTNFKLTQLGDGGAPDQVIYEHTWDPSFASHPPILRFPMDSPMLVKKGTRFNIACDWANDTSSEIDFPREMCLSFMYYYPDNGELDCEVQH